MHKTHRNRGDERFKLTLFLIFLSWITEQRGGRRTGRERKKKQTKIEAKAVNEREDEEGERGAHPLILPTLTNVL